MNTLDLLIVIFAVSAGVGGYRIGFVARAASWAGMALGLLVAARLLPSVISRLEGGDQVRLLLLAAGVLIMGAFLGQAVGLIVGARLKLVLPPGPVRAADRAGGAVAGVLGVLISVWLLLPAMSDIPEWPAEQSRNSTIAHAIDSVFPPPPDTLQALRHLIGEDNFPRVFNALRAAPNLGPPPVGTGLSEETANRVAASTVKVEGVACRRIQDGSGSVIGPDLVATNAHVVAGETRTTVQRHPDGAVLPATVVAFDPNRDIAILQVPGLGRPALPIGDIGPGGAGGVFGHPGGGDLRIAPFQVGEEVTARGTDIYDAHDYERQVFFLAAQLMPGDSGAPLVDPAGAVVGIAFAIAPDRPNVAYALTTEELQAVLGTVGPQPVATGPCLH